MSAAARAKEYERRFPGACDDEAQRAERMDRLAFKEERQAGRRTTRSKGIIVPALPWMEDR